jgi:hypothetical protein
MSNQANQNDSVFNRRQLIRVGAAGAVAIAIASLSLSNTVAQAASDPYAPPAKPALPPSDMVLDLK